MKISATLFLTANANKRSNCWVQLPPSMKAGWYGWVWNRSWMRFERSLHLQRY